METQHPRKQKASLFGIWYAMELLCIQKPGVDRDIIVPVCGTYVAHCPYPCMLDSATVQECGRTTREEFLIDDRDDPGHIVSSQEASKSKSNLMKILLEHTGKAEADQFNESTATIPSQVSYMIACQTRVVSRASAGA
jgi:hypothetical protein